MVTRRTRAVTAFGVAPGHLLLRVGHQPLLAA